MAKAKVILCTVAPRLNYVQYYLPVIYNAGKSTVLLSGNSILTLLKETSGIARSFLTSL